MSGQARNFHFTPTRRGVIAGASAAAGAALLAGAPGLRGPVLARGLPPPATAGADKLVEVELVAGQRFLSLPCFGGKTLPGWTFAEGAWPTVIRLNYGERLRAKFVNTLPSDAQQASIHWHGIRLPNDQDGVPYLTQPPVAVGDMRTYEFTPPDTGTFFFHTHCNGAEQIGRGLVGILIIDGDAERKYDADQLLVIRDWRVGPQGFLPFYTAGGASKAGTFGTVRSVNGITNPVVKLPAEGDCRLRLVNTDPSRIMEIGFEGADAAVVAIDGIALPPFKLDTWRMAPATRLDIVIRAPRAGQVATLNDYFAAKPVTLARLTGEGAPRRKGAFSPAPLRAGRIPAPDLKDAIRARFEFAATSGPTPPPADWNGLPLGTLCESEAAFWAINKQAWPVHGQDRLPPPLATLERGKTYRWELANLTPQQHPIHIHGHSFTVLDSNKRKLPRHNADTVLLLPNERVDVAFVADNPGDWMMHCHIIEHQESGMMGYFRVA
jgi:FtsP/CotA-like multicopper oxidase with cupredoxin domain